MISLDASYHKGGLLGKGIYLRFSKNIIGKTKMYLEGVLGSKTKVNVLAVLIQNPDKGSLKAGSLRWPAHPSPR